MNHSDYAVQYYNVMLLAPYTHIYHGVQILSWWLFNMIGKATCKKIHYTTSEKDRVYGI